jgi:diaminopimelate decarboxylase
MRVNGKNHLEIGGVDTVFLAREFGTPLYVVDEACFRDNCRRYREAFAGGEVIYAGKTMLVKAVCRLVEEEGLSLDVASGGELACAISAGFPASRLYFHGNNKTPAEIRMGLESGVGRFMVDNLYELGLLSQAAARTGVRQGIILRVTPGIEAHTHEYIKTGQIDSKFGLPIETGQAMEGVEKALVSPNLVLKGIHCHIGSQVFELESFEHTVRIMMNFLAQVHRSTGHLLEELDLGGGLGIYYAEGDLPPAVSGLAGVITATVGEAAVSRNLPVPRVLVEPGRSIGGPSGTTLYTVGAVKVIPGVRTYVDVDGGMNDNPRTALYGARYEALLANRAGEAAGDVVAVAGNCCESGDMLIHEARLPAPRPGDILAISATGAYNFSMSMNYNRFPRPAMVLVNEGRADLILRRETYEDVLDHDVIPPRLRIREALRKAAR